jgi:hypothetical protein
MLTFNDLDFEAHPCGNGQRAKFKFYNGYSVSVVFGDMFYSNGVDTYELTIFNPEGDIDYSTELTDDVLGYQTAEEITKAMKFVNDLPNL